MALNENGVKKVKPVAAKPKTIEILDDFIEKLDALPLAKEISESKSPSFRKDYLVWIIGAKTAATKQKEWSNL